MGRRLMPIARWSIHATGLAGSSRAPTSRISLSSRLMTIRFCIRRRCSRAPFLLRGVSPRGRRTAEQRDERATLHSITSSARASSVAGMSTPSIRAVCALMTSSNLADCTTGKWAGLAETLGVETGPDMPTSVAAYLEENADVWDQIVAKYDLRSRNLVELVGHGDQHADVAFAYGSPEGPRAFVSTIKLRQAGFTKTIDTEDSFRNALQSLIDHKLLPPAGKL